jgi:hypothetical protein
MLLDDETFSTKNIKGNLVKQNQPSHFAFDLFVSSTESAIFFHHPCNAMQVQEQHTELPHQKQYTAPYYKQTTTILLYIHSKLILIVRDKEVHK